MITNLIDLLYKIESYKYFSPTYDYILSNFKDRYCVNVTLAAHSTIEVSKDVYDMLRNHTKFSDGCYYAQPNKVLNLISYQDIVKIQMSIRQTKLSKI